ncbi:hypothetical protein HY624_03735 [Candidatus Uhrbacteria bacterium]|nr:hypothetical protein [Candidatus Uhrbacteria bacterium]
MIIFAAITPHSPLFVPSVGKENRERLALSLNSFIHLRNALATLNPDVLVIISPHGPMLEKSFPIGMMPEYDVHFEQFGDFATRVKLPGDILLPTLIKQSLETTMAITSIGESVIDHGIAIPALELTRGALVPIVPVGVSLLNYSEHYQFGSILAPILEQGERRIAVVASAELSHRLGPLAPLGYSPHGSTFDAHILELITQHKLSSLVDIDPALARETGSCGIAPIAMLAGILHARTVDPEILSYEAPFGIGYATIDLRLGN